MIFVTDKGRLANNILQYGHLYAWGREHGRRTMSMRFAYKYHDFRICHTAPHNFITYLLAKAAVKLRLMPTVQFDDINSDYAEQQRVMLERRNVFAIGWCVRFPDLFEKYKAEIQQLFAFDDCIEDKVRSRLVERGSQALRLGVHIRRGDYATWCGGHYFYDDRQYEAVIRQFVGLFPQREADIYICGNDPQMDRSIYVEAFGANHVHFPDGSPTEDLCLLSHCDYLIGPPSTFTLVASMYHDALLYWIANPEKALTTSSFGRFNQLFRDFDDYFIPS